MIRGDALQITHASVNRRWFDLIASIEEEKLRRYAAHAAILLIVLLSALVAL
jgi:hypothetical protein